jgi:hypothetical protein
MTQAQKAWPFFLYGVFEVPIWYLKEISLDIQTSERSDSASRPIKMISSRSIPASSDEHIDLDQRFAFRELRPEIATTSE